MMEFSELNRYFPGRGPCAFCGHQDVRHHLWDAIIVSPDSDVEVAENYDLPVAAVQAVRMVRPYQ